MARTWPKPWQPPTALTASVSVIDREQRKKIGSGPAAKWQDAAWDAYENIGEVKHSARYKGNGVARCSFFVGMRETPEDGLQPIPADAEGVSVELSGALERIRGIDGTFASLARQYGIQQFVVGESHLVGLEGQDGEVWEMLSPQEIRKLENGGYGRASSSGATNDSDYDSLSDDAFVLRMWQRHPKIRALPDSPLRGVLEICEALRVAQATMTAIDRSRLILDGLLLFPSDAELPPVPGSEADGRKRLQLLDDLFEAAMARMEDPGSAPIPILLEMKGALIEQVKHLTFDRTIDEKITERIAYLIRRYAQGVDLPIEVVTGIGDANHWSAWASSQESAVAYIGPVAAQFCEDLTAGILLPHMKSLEIPHHEQWRYAIGYDPSDLTTNPNRFQDTLELADRFAVSFAYLRDVANIPETAKPSAEEVMWRLAIEQVQTQAGAEPDPAAQPVEAAGDGVSGDRTPPEGDGTGPAAEQSPPAEDPAGPANTRNEIVIGRTVGAAEMAIEVAMGRAGAKIRSNSKRRSDLLAVIDGRPNPTLAASLGPGQCATVGLDEDSLLDGAWDTLAPRLEAWMGRPGAATVLSCVDAVARAKLWRADTDVSTPVMDTARQVVAAGR